MGEPIKIDEDDVKTTRKPDSVMSEKETKKREKMEENSKGGGGCPG